ncbi:GC-rich sequence DNA-binding factor 2, partial [Chytriomyces hyalinus]
MFSVRKKTNKAKTRIRQADSDNNSDNEAGGANTVPQQSKQPAKHANKQSDKIPAVSFSAPLLDGEDSGMDALAALKARREKRERREKKAALSSSSASAPTSTAATSATTSAAGLYSQESLKLLADSQMSLSMRAPLNDNNDNSDDANLDATRILDSAEIFALKKLRDEKRNRMANAANEEANDEDFISLDSKSSKKLESRLVTEEQEEDEPEPFEAHQGSRIQFGNKTADELKRDRKKAIQATLGDIHDNDSDEGERHDDDMWQQDQIRKAASLFSNQSRRNKSSINDDDEEDPRFGNEFLGYDEFAIPNPTPLLAPAKVVSALTETLAHFTLESEHSAAQLAHLETARAASLASKARIEADLDTAKKRYTFYQELVARWSSFADLLDAKMPLFEELVGQLEEGCGALKDAVEDARRERLDAVLMAASVVGSGDALMVDEFGRELKGGGVVSVVTAEDVAVLVSTEEQVSTSQLRAYAEAVESIQSKRTILLSDVSEEYKDMKVIVALFSGWKDEYDGDFRRSYARLTVHQALAPFVKIQICDWNPFEAQAIRMDDMSWHDLISQMSEFDAEDPSDLDSDPLICLVVKKSVLPHVKKLVATVDLFSKSAMKRLVSVLFMLEEHAGRKSAAFKGLMDAVVGHVEATVMAVMKAYPADMTQPIDSAPISKVARDAVFWHAFTLFSNLFSLRAISPRDSLKSVLIDTLLNQYLLAFLAGPMACPEDVLKYEA